MSAIITETFRRKNASRFVDDIIASNYYLGIGKSDPWPEIAGLDEDHPSYVVENPLGTYADREDVKHNLTTLIKVGTDFVSNVIPKVTHDSTKRNKAYNPYSLDCFYESVVGLETMAPCYTVGATGDVYLCLKEATAAPTILPAGLTREVFEPGSPSGDGSRWVLIYRLTDNSSLPIDISQFISVPDQPAENGLINTAELAEILTESGSLTYGFTVIDGGSGYTQGGTSASFIPDVGAAIPLTVVVTAGEIVSVSYAPGSWVNHGGYVLVTGDGTGARVYPNTAPALGFGSVPSADLPSWYVGLNAKANDLLGLDGAYIPFRQISILKDPTQNAASYRCTMKVNVTPSTPSLPTGSLITHNVSNAIGIVDYVSGSEIFYHQTRETGFIPFTTGAITSDAGVLTIDSVTASEYDYSTGEVVFVENRKKITRTAGQEEDITLILTF